MTIMQYLFNLRKHGSGLCLFRNIFRSFIENIKYKKVIMPTNPEGMHCRPSWPPTYSNMIKYGGLCHVCSIKQ